MSTLLQGGRFGHIEDLGRVDIADRYYGDFKQGVVAGAGPLLVAGLGWAAYPNSA